MLLCESWASNSENGATLRFRNGQSHLQSTRSQFSHLRPAIFKRNLQFLPNITYTITVVIIKDHCCCKVYPRGPLWQAKEEGADGHITDGRGNRNTDTRASALYPLA